MNAELDYFRCLETILSSGHACPNRTGTKALTVPHLTIQHDMTLGFPLLTTKKMPFRTIKVELEGFLKGITDKAWYQQRGCHIWDEWCSPELVAHISDPEERKKAQVAENFLGPIYGHQWRHFNSSDDPRADQIASILEKLKKDPTDRRMLCSAWNPLVLHQQALPPCHVVWHVTVIGSKLSLCWFQRSCDFFLGVPFNIASYGLLLHLLAKHAGLKEGTLTGFFSNAHIYENHLAQVEEQLKRTPRLLPVVFTDPFSGLLDWEHKHSNLTSYDPYPVIKAEVAV